jgi:hypothetical protein
MLRYDHELTKSESLDFLEHLSSEIIEIIGEDEFDFIYDQIKRKLKLSLI